MPRRARESRRGFLRRAGAFGALVALAPVAGCGRKSDPGRESPPEDAAESAAPAGGDPCADLAGLTEDQKSFREDVGYVAETPIPEERCDNCQYWRAPRGEAPCGSCTVIAGPIHPAGYCDLWEEQS